MKNQNLVSQKIRILYKIHKKGYFKYKCQASEEFSFFLMIFYIFSQFLSPSPFFAAFDHIRHLKLTSCNFATFQD